MSDMGMGKRCLKIGVQPKLDEHYFGLGQQQSEKAMPVTRPTLFCSILTVETFFKASIIVIHVICDVYY